MFTQHHLDDNMVHGASRLRALTPENVKEDMSLLHKGILDYDSFWSGYSYHNHPVEFVLTDSGGELKFIRRTHNLRTDVGGTQQGNAMSGTPGTIAHYIGLATSAITPVDGDIYLGSTNSHSGTNAESSSGNLTRTLASFLLSAPPAGATSTTTAQGTYKLTAQWVAINVTGSIYGCGVFDAASSGNLWFEAVTSTIPVGVGDNLTLTYTINF